MVTSSDPVEKAKDYASNKFLVLCEEITQQSQEDLVAARAQLAARGLARSGSMEKAVGDNLADRIKKLIQARVDTLIDGFEIYGVSITDELTNYIIEEAEIVYSAATSSSKSLASAGDMRPGTIAHHIVSRVNVSIPSIRCQIEERRVIPKMTSQPPSVTNVYHITGANSRLNVQSTDLSVNVVVTSSDQIFQKIREGIESSVPGEQQQEIIARLEALEKAQNTSSFGARYTEFIAAAANHMTLIAPFIPALTEILQKAL